MKPLLPFIRCGVAAIVLLALAAGCTTGPVPGTPVARHGDEIVAAGQAFRIGTPVVLWTDPGGYDAYRVERRFSPIEESGWEASREAVSHLRTPNRYNLRREQLSDEQIEQVRGGGWDLALLQEVVDQFVLHYDVAGTARNCFNILHDQRGLSVHFLLDLDGTLYQTLDLKERAWHATSSNARSIAIEIANIGAYSVNGDNPFDQWYATDADGRVRIMIPERLRDGGIRAPDFVGRPARNEPVIGTVQGTKLIQYDLTPEQYGALVKLTAGLSRIFPKIKVDYPRDEEGGLITRKLDEDVLENTQGLIGHFHIQRNKVDPGPAFDWDYVVENARALLDSGRGPRLRR